MQKTLMTAAVLAAVFGLAACSNVAPRDTYDAIGAEVARAGAKPGAQADAVTEALLPPVAELANQLPKARAVLEERFNVAFNNVPVQQFFNSVVAGTRYNMLIHPEVSGNITANLKDVTLFEALDAVRELYGYDYKVEGNKIYIRPLTIQTRMFKVNYLTSTRVGQSNLRVTSTSVSDATGSSNSGNSNNNGNNQNNQSNSGNNQNGNSDGNNNGNNNGSDSQSRRVRDASNVVTRSQSDFWSELALALEAIVGGKQGGRSVVISPQSGVILVRAMPEELRNVDAYLKASQLSVERQVILEAKILEVELNSGFQSGINWSAFAQSPNSKLSAGVIAPGTTLRPSARNANSKTAVPPALIATDIVASSGFSLGSAADAAGTLFGLAFQTSNFAALISFLEAQGTVHVLSSPRIATLNNQKAVLKIGTDEFFVTGVSTTVTSSGVGATTASPNVTLQSFFSGVVLDVTPQIDDRGNVMLHVHPSVSQVSTVNKTVNLGTVGSLNLPLAASVTSEMDSMVRGQDGKVVAIGGLMRHATTSDRAGVPGASNLPVVGALFRNTNEVSQKRELVVLIKPTIVESGANWNEDLLDAGSRIKALDPNRDKERR